MNSYQDRKLIPMPTPKPYNEMTEAELQHVLATAINHNQLIPALIEANRRKDEQIHALSKRISALEEKAAKRQAENVRHSILTEKNLLTRILCTTSNMITTQFPNWNALSGRRKISYEIGIIALFKNNFL